MHPTVLVDSFSAVIFAAIDCVPTLVDALYLLLQTIFSIRKTHPDLAYVLIHSLYIQYI